MACDILRRQIENQQNIIIPSITLKDIYQKRQIPLFNESYTGKKEFNQTKFKNLF
jgi:hypothetical protein